MTEYRKFKLSSGQQAPDGSTGHGLSDNWIVWIGEANSFPEEIESELMTRQEKIDYLKINPLNQLAIDRNALQEAGYTCANGIKLNVGEVDLLRWTQLMTGLISFEPTTVNIRDYDNIVHQIPIAEAFTMLAEVFAWGQTFIAETWILKDQIISTIEAEVDAS